MPERMQWLLVGTQACPMALSYGLLHMDVVVSSLTAHREDMGLVPALASRRYIYIFFFPLSQSPGQSLHVLGTVITMSCHLAQDQGIRATREKEEYVPC